jgi:hypothetical protein
MHDIEDPQILGAPVPNVVVKVNWGSICALPVYTVMFMFV